MEEWRVIPGFERYEVSNMGCVRRGNKLIKPCPDSYGYRQVNVYRDGKRYCRKVYRLVMQAFVPNTENKPHIDHVNRDRSDDRLENLRWVTVSENCRNKEGFIEEMFGIGWNKKNSKYTVRVYANGKETYYGSRTTLEEAKELRDKALNRDVVFVSQKDREMYGIRKDRERYAVQIGTNYIGSRHTVEEAMVLRDEYLNKSKNEDN